MPEGLSVRVLGPLEVTVGGTPVGPAGIRRRSVLAVLALIPGEVCDAGALVEAVWGPRPPPSAAGVLQTTVSTWRKALDAAGVGGAARLATVGSGYRLHLSPGECDLLEFRALSDEGRRGLSGGRTGEARELLGRALALWRGDVLADLTGAPFHAELTAPLADARVDVLLDWADAVLAAGPDADLAAVVAGLVEERQRRPWDERLAGLLVWALFRQGRQRAALDLFEQTRRALADELGVDPGPALRSLHERVLRHDTGLLPAAGPLRPVRAPTRLDAFVGREQERAEVAELLRQQRLVTLTGPGGAGKTRLAEEVAAHTDADVPAVLVELASLSDPALVPATVAARLGLPSAETVDALATMVTGRPLLLVLDNLEHLRGVGPLVAALLRRTDGVRVLATSREPLRVAGEQLFEVRPLPVPAPYVRGVTDVLAAPAIALLVARARADDPHFVVTDDNADVLARIARALDGLPLALEIVAPWLRPLSPSGVLEHLERILDLRMRSGDVERRHRTLRDTIAWSHDRLRPPEQALFARLSVLRGGGDLPAVEAVGGPELGAPVVDLLVDLVDRHLVQAAEPVAGRPRFRLLETVREFAAERLAERGDAEDAAARAARWFASWATDLARHSEGPDTARWLDRAIADADNLRAAIDHLAAIDPEARLQLVVDAMVLWFEAGHELEGERRLAAALAGAPPESPARAIALAYLAWLTGTHDARAAAEAAAEAVGVARAAGDDPVLAFALQTLGDTSSDPSAAEAASTEAAALAEQLTGAPVRYGPTAGEAVACGAAHNLAAVWAYRSVPTALSWQRRALALAEREGDRRITAVNSARLGALHLVAGDPGSAAAPIGRAEELLPGPVTARWEDIVRFARAELLRWQDDDEAHHQLSVLTTSALAGGRLLHLVLGSCALAEIELARGALGRAEEVLDRAEAALAVSVDPVQLARLRVRRARWLRLAGRPEDAAATLEAIGKDLDPDALPPERVVHLVEHALLAEDPAAAIAWVDRLDGLAERTGVAVPPWERRLLAALPVGP